jgi:PadR family transcriptional regulator, regulatory protein PadR
MPAQLSPDWPDTSDFDIVCSEGTMDQERELLKGNTPALVLAVLRDQPLHGYAIAREIERRSGDALRCKEGTLYPALHSLEEDGFIQGEWQREGGKRERKVYTLTQSGVAELERRTRTWEKFAAAVQGVMNGGTNDPASDAEPGGAGGAGRAGGMLRPQPA